MALTALTEAGYRNPILPGFHPDPSVVRVGGDYYMANSTFQFFPGIVISHSKDLVNWTYIGHGIERSEHLPLRDLPDSYGIWAPDISYHEGTYYLFATLRLHGAGRQNLMMTSTAPGGPYSKPAVINEIGLDPSHFIDEDGTHYMVYGGGGAWLQRLTADCAKAAGEPVKLWDGTGRASPEGPHLIKKDGYYYIILAEGGTEYGHCVTAARCASLFGPYEPCPFNPVHTQTDPNAVIQRAGHGKLVQTQNGDWWMVHLGGRPLSGGYCTLGRETFLEPVRWREDGWFEVNGGRGPSEVQRRPLPVAALPGEPRRDDFDGGALPLHWCFARNPYDDNWSLSERSGHVRIWTAGADLDSIDSQNVLVRRERHHVYEAVLKLEFEPGMNGEQAGLICYYDTRCFVKLALTYDGGLKIKLTENRARTITELEERAYSGSGQVYLKAEVNREKRSFYYSKDGTDWIPVGAIKDATFLSDEGTREKKAFTGTMVGIYANNGGSGRRIPADFDWFEYAGKPG